MQKIVKIFSLAVGLVFVMYAKPPVVSGNRMPSLPYISGDGFRSMANHVFDETDRSLQGHEVALGDIVFVKTDLLSAFFKEVHLHIQHKYILVSHNADHSAPAEFEAYLADEKIIKWFGQNPTIEHHDAFAPIPIGVGNRYVGDHGNCDNYKPYVASINDTRPHILGYNFCASSNAPVRGELLHMFASQAYVVNLSARPHICYIANMRQAKFILSPEGNGLDCHRTWEALIVGTIPILHSSMLDELLDGLPVVIVDDWSVINKEWLEAIYPLVYKRFHEDAIQKITYTYWYNHLMQLQQSVRS